ncbi:MAG: YggT family protein [Candidatus Dormibacteria bacterium]
MSTGRLISGVITLFTILVVARAFGSFFIRDWSRGVPRFIYDVTEPVLGTVRRILPPMGGLDFSPVVVILLLQFVGQFIRG